MLLSQTEQENEAQSHASISLSPSRKKLSDACAGPLSHPVAIEAPTAGGSRRPKRASLKQVTERATFAIRQHVIGNQAFSKTPLVIGMIVIWYTMSLTLTACNKILLDSLAFPYPVFVTFIHFTGVALVARTAVVYIKGSDNVSTVDPLTYIGFMLPIAFFSAMEIALTNQAYSMVSLSVMTVVKSTLVAATYIASIIADLEVFRWQLMLVLLWIIVSVAISVPGMQVQNSWGLAVLVLAVICAAVRWVLIHKQLQNQQQESHISSLDLIALTQPLAALCLLPAALFYDTPDLIENILLDPADSQRECAIAVLLLAAIILVCLLLYCEFKLIELTSSLTLTVAGVGKECCTIAMSTVVFNERLHWRAVVGLALSLLGITAYGIVRNKLGPKAT